MLVGPERDEPRWTGLSPASCRISRSTCTSRYIRVRSIWARPCFPRAGNLVSVVVGMRRSGKTYRLFQEMRRLLDDGVPPAQMLYFNFEDDRLKPLTSAVGDAVLDAFFELHPEAHERGAYLFLDEVQEIEDWGTWLRRIIDTKKVTVYATGSSSKLLSADVATAFRGRSVGCALLPMSASGSSSGATSRRCSAAARWTAAR